MIDADSEETFRKYAEEIRNLPENIAFIDEKI
jgi:hypothetical protein